MNKKITIGAVFLILLILALPLGINAFGASEALGWIISAQKGNVKVKAVCAVGSPAACKGLQWGIDPQGQVTGEGVNAMKNALGPDGSELLDAYMDPTGTLTQEGLNKFAEEKPELAGELGEALTISEQLQELNAEGDVKFEEGTVSQASIAIEKEGEVGNLVGKDIKKEEILAKDITFEKKDGISTFTFEEGGYVKIKDKLFMNIQKGGVLKLNENGDVIEADITSTERGTYELGNRKIQVAEGVRVVYKDEKLDIYGQGKTVQIDELEKITIDGESIRVDGQTITGKEFTIGGKNFKGMERRDGEVTLTDEGYILGKNTIAEDPAKFTVTSKEGNVLLSKTCKDTSGFDNHVSACRGTLNMEGKGFSIQLKEGNNFVKMNEGDTLIYDMNGGQVKIEDNAAEITLKELGTSVKVTNGELEMTHKRTPDGIQITTDPDSGEPDVKLTTVTELDEWSCAIETDQDGSTISYCPESSTPTTTLAVTDITGMFDFKKLKEKCLERVNNAKNSVTEKLKKLSKKGEPLTLGDGTIVYPQTVKQVDIEGVCEGCEYYNVKTSEGEITVSIDENGIATFEDEEGGRHVLSDEEKEALGLVPPSVVPSASLPSRRPPGLPPGDWTQEGGTFKNMDTGDIYQCSEYDSEGRCLKYECVNPPCKGDK